MPGGKKRDNEEFVQNANSWMTTYTDLMTLLLTFFVLLLSLSIIDSHKQRLALNSLIGAFGFKPGANAVLGDDKGLNVTVGTTPMTKEDIDFQRLQNIAIRNGLAPDVQIRREAERIIISLGNRVLFAQGSSQIEPGKEGFLSELASALKKVPGRVELRGYADPTETLLERDPLETSMNLSTKRALSVFHSFVKDKIPPKKMVAHGFGTLPLKKDVDNPQKGFNRQVEVICDYRSRLPFRLRKKPPQKDVPFDFKGFMFNLKEKQGG